MYSNHTVVDCLIEKWVNLNLMLKKLFALILFSCVCIGFFNEVQEFESLNSKEVYSVSENHQSSNKTKSDICHTNDSHNDCNDANGHCSHHCAGLQFIFSISSPAKLYSASKKISSNYLSYSYIYLDPLLRKSVKPPLYS